jgi:hypothetical protein
MAGIGRTKMKARDYLAQIRRMDIIIAQDRQRLKELRSRMTSLGSMNYTKDRVQQTPSDQMTDKLAAYMDMIEEIERQEVLLEQRKKQVIAKIRQLQNATYMDLLVRYYVNYQTKRGRRKTLDDVAREMNYSPEHIRRLHRQALIEFQKLLDK